MKSLVSLLLTEQLDVSVIESQISKYRSLKDAGAKDSEMEVFKEELNENLHEAALTIAQQLAQMKIDSIEGMLHKLIPGDKKDPIVRLIFEELVNQLDTTDNTYSEMITSLIDKPRSFGIDKELNEYAQDILFGRREK